MRLNDLVADSVADWHLAEYSQIAAPHAIWQLFLFVSTECSCSPKFNPKNYNPQADNIFSFCKSGIIIQYVLFSSSHVYFLIKQMAL